MALIYIQQNGSEGKKIPYTNKTHPTSTIATSGCGCCSSLMVLLNTTSYPMTLKKWAKILMNKGARHGEGTDMRVVGKIMKDNYGFEYSHTTDIEKLKAHLKKGHKAIVNVGGKGYFSSGGHFVFVAGITKDGKAIVLDPYYYNGKWESVVKGINRNKYFKYNALTHEVICSFEVIAADSKSDKYHLFTPTKKIHNSFSAQDIVYINAQKKKKDAEAQKKKETSKSNKASQTTSSSNNTATKNTYSKWKGYVTALTLNIRAEASSKAKIIGTLPKDSVVVIEGEKGSFYQIVYKNKKAYIAKQYIAKSKPKTTWKGYVTASALNVRNKPNTNAKIVGTLKQGSSVEVLGESGGFYVIKYKNQKSYVSKKYIKKK